MGKYISHFKTVYVSIMGVGDVLKSQSVWCTHGICKVIQNVFR